MAGENVTERIVRKVFSQSLDLVVHVDRDDTPPNDSEGIRRQVMEIVAVVPALSEDFTVEPIFVRQALGRPLVWTPSADRSAAARSIVRLLAAVDLRHGRTRRARPRSRPSGRVPRHGPARVRLQRVRTRRHHARLAPTLRRAPTALGRHHSGPRPHDRPPHDIRCRGRNPVVRRDPRRGRADRRSPVPRGGLARDRLAAGLKRARLGMVPPTARPT
jgi:hypothetical protein